MTEKRMHPPSEELFAYRDGELTPDKRAVIEAHVLGCSTCRALIDQVSALEAELRQSPDAAPAGYLDHLGESVRARIAVSSSGSAGRERVKDRAPAAAPARRRVGEDVEERPVRGRVKEVPKLPWAAVIGTASAAMAVLVVVVILIRQGPYQRMVMLPRERAATPEAKQEAAGTKKEAAGTPSSSPPVERNVPAPAEAPAPSAAGNAVEEKNPAQPPAAEPEKTDLDQKVALKDELAKRADEPGQGTRAQAPLGMAGAGEKVNQEEDQSAKGKLQAAAPRDMARRESMITEAGYTTILNRYGLPPVWNDRVSPSSLASAEPELRSYYMSGAAGSDSARVRLYLAEAARLRYAPGDSELYGEIRHHYQRVIELAGPDEELARVARDRARSLEK